MSEVTRPIPAPRRSKQKVESDEVDKSLETNKYENVTLVKDKRASAEVYENVQLLISSKKINNTEKITNNEEAVNENVVPKPAPRKKLSGIKESSLLQEETKTEKDVAVKLPKKEEKTSELENTPKPMGAIRKAPTAPTTNIIINNDFQVHKKSSSSGSYDLNCSESSSSSKRERSNSIHSSNSGSNSFDNSGYYKTSSPKELLRSLGATSKLLSESLTERAKHKIDKNYRKSKEKVETWTLEKRKTAQKKLKKLTPNNLSLLKSPSSKNTETDMKNDNVRMSVPINDELFRDLSFTSPLSNKANNIEDLSRLSMYEVPKLNKRVQESLPPYDEIIDKDENWDRLDFKRNDLTTKSLSKLNNKKSNKEIFVPTVLTRVKSESNIEDTIESASSSGGNTSIESIPCPNYPAPVLSQEEGIYGKIKKISRHVSNDTDDDDDSQVVLLREKKFTDDTGGTVRATYDITEEISSIPSSNISKWSYIDTSALENDSSSPEPIYANNNIEHSGTKGTLYEIMSEMKSNLLHPVPSETIAGDSSSFQCNTRDDMNNVLDASFEVVQEFDPLLNAAKNGSDGLNLIENLMSGDNYTNVNIVGKDSSDGDSIQSDNLPTPPERFDSLPKEEIIVQQTIKTPPLPLSLLRKKKKEPIEKKPTIIIHQNLSLQADSMENLCDKGKVEQFLAQVEEPTNVSNEHVDLRKPSQKTTIWHDLNEDPKKFEKSVNIDPINVAATKTEKINKSMIPINQNNNGIQDEILPTYDEAMALGLAPSPSTSSISFKNRFVNLIKRRPSLNKPSKPEVKTILEMIPKPPLNDKYISHRGHFLKLPSGALEDLMKELSPRYFEIRDQKFVTCADNSMTQIKENFLLKHITSVQTVISNKFNSESGVELHCFEINIAIPKTHNTPMSNTNMVLTSNSSGNVKTQKSSYIYGLHRKSERNSVMKKILESFIDKFPINYTEEFTRCGWCYIKKSISSEWVGAWLLLCRRRLLFYNFNDKIIENLDLRKARLLTMKDNDDSILNLHVEKGPCFLIDCPPYTTLYMIMDSSKETKMWKAIVKDAAHSNGSTLKQQQLTKDNIPVLVDKCINFIYAYGSMTEGIYRKVGSTNNVQKLLKQFRTDAFAVELTRGEYSEHDASSCLKKFMRDLPAPLLGAQSMQFIAVSDMRNDLEKIKCYQELLERLPTVEYQTLKKIVGHLHFIESQKIRNKMNIDNLSMVWGPTLIRNPSVEEVQYSQKECDVMKDLIHHFKTLFPLSNDEIRKEQIMLTVLKKYHEAAENLSDVKKSGDLRIWIAVDANPDNTLEEKLQINVTLTPLKTVYEVCKELSPKLKLDAYKTTMYEIICNKELERPMHYNEKVLDTVCRWTAWSEEDRKNNILVIRPSKFLYEIERALTNTPSLTPNSELKFADRKSKNLKPYILELTDSKITVMKREKQNLVKVKDISLNQVIAYIGCESKREQNLRWAITLIENDFKKRTKDSPYSGLVFGGDMYNDLILWYSSIIHSLHKNDLLPQPDLVIP
uniref:CSON015025 protein n=1 Tax=Culicoides sonorensis TaxID=179676 RepID=A0A336KS94_CULSO